MFVWERIDVIYIYITVKPEKQNNSLALKAHFQWNAW